MSDTANPNPNPPHPPIINYILSFLLVGFAWGFTTPFMRAAARTYKPLPTPEDEASKGWVKRKLGQAWRAIVGLLKNPRYAVPLVVNLTGSVWFFLLIGKAELSLTVPIVNTLAFLFTVLGEWYVERKVISRDTLIGMLLSVAGIALCVHSKNRG